MSCDTARFTFSLVGGYLGYCNSGSGLGLKEREHKACNGRDKCYEVGAGCSTVQDFRMVGDLRSCRAPKTLGQRREVQWKDGFAHLQ